MKPTIRDVAKKANVSVSTVSRVINKKGYVHKDTVDVVEKVIQEIGFVPNLLARSLTSRSSKIIGVIVPHIGPTFYGDLLEGIESQASTSGYKTMFCHTQDDPEREIEYLKFFEQYNIEGLIIASNFTSTEKLLNLNIPIITVDHILDPNIPSITSDNVLGGELGAQELIDRGRKNIMIFRGPSFLLTTVERTIGALNVFKKNNIYVEIFDFDIVNPETDLIKEILDNHPEVDGIFAFSDTIALATMNLIKKSGRDVPKDVSIVGYDNSMFANWVIPQLTSINQPVTFMGKQAFIKLSKLIREKELNTLHDVIKVELVKRESV